MPEGTQLVPERGLTGVRNRRVEALPVGLAFGGFPDFRIEGRMEGRLGFGNKSDKLREDGQVSPSSTRRRHSELHDLSKGFG